MTYSEKLKDPRWQKKRLEIFQRDDFSCQLCESKEKTLHVHHRYYLGVNYPWDYPNKALVTLCEDCHQAEEEMKDMKTKFLNEWLGAGMFNVDMEGISLDNIKLSRWQISSLLMMLDNEDFCKELMELYTIHRTRFLDSLKDDGLAF